MPSLRPTDRRSRRSACIRLLSIAAFASLTFAASGDSDRVESLAGKLRCTCGCGEVLAECSHLKCETKASLKRELAESIDQGETDDKVLDLMGTRHGAAIRLTPAFNGFNTLLWLVPIVLGVLGIAVVVFGRFWSGRRQGGRVQ